MPSRSRKMEHQVSTYLLQMFFFIKEVSMCIPGEYLHENECCPKCPPGSIVKIHCTNGKSTVCIPCEQNTYMDHPNGLTRCLRCKTCDSGAGLVTKKACTYTSNAECVCEEGSFCHTEKSEECDLCQRHTECSAGEMVKQAGTSRTDNICEKCPEGTFSNDSMSTCRPWTKCAKEEHMEKMGTNTSDALCKENNRKHWATFSATILSFLGCVAGDVAHLAELAKLVVLGRAGTLEQGFPNTTDATV
ncbi:tumor necrosis factor receptor superfamily member 14 [Pelodytes ibericus]